MNKKCPDCGSLNVEEVFDGESYCKDCFLHCATDDLEDASVFDRITQSPEVLAEALVYDIEWDWYSTIICNKGFSSQREAIAATVARLKEVCND
jgi:transcription initiation factor TFIIIB Brf1 subunit/transcription initiation factor TFIIB